MHRQCLQVFSKICMPAAHVCTTPTLVEFGSLARAALRCICTATLSEHCLLPILLPLPCLTSSNIPSGCVCLTLHSSPSSSFIHFHQPFDRCPGSRTMRGFTCQVRYWPATKGTRWLTWSCQVVCRWCTVCNTNTALITLCIECCCRSVHIPRQPTLTQLLPDLKYR